MRQPLLSACALLASFALGAGTALQVQKLADLDIGDVPGMAALGLGDVVLDADCRTHRVTVTRDGMIYLNELLVGDLDGVEPLETRLRDLEGHRPRAGAGGRGLGRCEHLPAGVTAGRGVEVVAPRSLTYGDLTRVLAAAEASGASPINLVLVEDSESF